MTKTSTAIVALCFATAGAPAAAQTSPSGGIGTLTPPPVSTPQGAEPAQCPPDGDRPSEQKPSRASH